MAKRGEIDPWNIDIIDLTDKFLQKIEDLRVSARVLLYASILLRMKADALLEDVFGGEEVEEVETDDFVDSFVDLDIDINDVDLKGLNLSLKKKTRRYTTLNELLKELKNVEKRMTTRKKKKRIAKDVFENFDEIPHEEDVEAKVRIVFEVLEERFKEVDELSFFDLVKGLNRSEVLSYYVSILHLAYREKLEVFQEKLYDDLLIKKR